jgi:hypothetical protein
MITLCLIEAEIIGGRQNAGIRYSINWFEQRMNGQGKQVNGAGRKTGCAYFCPVLNSTNNKPQA